MIAMARLQAEPEFASHVRQALEEMVEASRTADPALQAYALYESEDEPGCFLIEQRVSAVEDNLRPRDPERLMQLGTALREELNAPIEIARYRLITESRPA